MKSVMRTIVRIVTANKRNWTALKPKDVESDYNDLPFIVGNEHMVPGLQIASKVSIIICGVELDKPYMLPNFRVGTSQGVTTAQRVWEMVKSE